MIKYQREVLRQSLEEIRWIDTYPSEANFILCRVKGRSALDVKNYLRSQGILIRYFNKPGLSDHIRISVGTAEQTKKLVAAMKGLK